MGRPSLNGRPLQVRFPDDLIERVDVARGAETRSDFIRVSVQERLDGRREPAPKPAVPEGPHPDDEAALTALRASPGMTERELADDLGWMPGRVGKAVGRLSAAGLVWYPRPGCLEAMD